MATINGKVKIKTSDGFDVIHPETKVAQISDFSSELLSIYAAIDANKGIFYIEGAAGGTAGTWTGTSEDITSYYTGLTIAYKIQTAGSTNGTNLQINNLGSKQVRLNDVHLTTQYSVGTVVILVYDGVYWQVADGTNIAQFLLKSGGTVDGTITMGRRTTAPLDSNKITFNSGIPSLDGTSIFVKSQTNLLTRSHYMSEFTIFDSGNLNREFWNTRGFPIHATVGQLAWKNYGDNHTIIDASASTAPNGAAINNKDSHFAWGPTYPTLVGWNGHHTYGVRVDSARIADRSLNEPLGTDSNEWNSAGVLVTTNLDATAQEGASWTIEVTGKGYGLNPIKFIAEGYNYNHTFTSTGGYNYGTPFYYIKAFKHSDGNLAFWWPKLGYWNSYDVTVKDTRGAGRRLNCVVGINIDTAEPESDKKVQINLIQTYNTTTTQITLGPNTIWGKSLILGGTGNLSTADAGHITITSGNLHIDPATGGYATYLNYYNGTGGIAFGNGAGSPVAWMGPDGDLWKGSADNTGSKYWHAGNMGAGSGLDADTVDGYHSWQNSYENTYRTYGPFVQYTQQSANTTENPDGDWWSTIKLLHDNTSGYFTQLAFPFHSENLSWRRNAGGTESGWKKIWHEGNLNIGSDSTNYAAGNHAHGDLYSATNHLHDDRYYTKFEIQNNTIYARRLLVASNGVPTSNLGQPSLQEMALFDEQFTNKTAFYDISKIKFYGYDGYDWSEIVEPDHVKRTFVGGDASTSVLIPNLIPKYRIEIVNSGEYVFLDALYMYWSSQSHATKVHIWRRAYDTQVWERIANSDEYISAWPGHMYLPFPSIPFGPTFHYDAIRIEFEPWWSGHETYGTHPIHLHKLQIWGGYPAGKRNIYTTYDNKQVEFPNYVQATDFLTTNKADQGLRNNAGTAWLRVDDAYNNMHAVAVDGIYLEANNLFFRNKSYVNRFVIHGSTGNVGIGTDSPNVRLEVSNGDDTNTARFSYSPAPNGYYLNLRQSVPTGGVVAWHWDLMNNNTSYQNMMVFREGKIGIGTNVPDHQLTIAGNIGLMTGANRFIRFGSASNFYYDVGAVGDDFNINDPNYGSRLYIKYPTGNIGIGTTQPTTKLQVLTSLSVIPGDAARNDGYIATLESYHAETTGLLKFAGGGGAGKAIGVTGYGVHTQIFANNTERIRITNGGAIGLGTTNPTSRIVTVVDTANVSPAYGSNSSTFSILKADSGDVGLYGLLTGIYSNGNVWQQVQRVDSFTDVYNLILQPLGGRVGIDTTAPFTKLHVNGSHDGARISLWSPNPNGDSDASKTARLNLWASEPGWTYAGVGIGHNVYSTPTEGSSDYVIDTNYDASWIRFERGTVQVGQKLVNGTVRVNTLINASGHLLELGNRVYSAGNNNIGSGSSNYAAGNHGHSEYFPYSGGGLSGMLSTRESSGLIGVGYEVGTPGIDVRSVDQNQKSDSAAYIIFHRINNYAVRFGLDGDNKLKIGGFTMGHNAYEIYHQGNKPSLYDLSNVNISGNQSAGTLIGWDANAEKWVATRDFGHGASQMGSIYAENIYMDYTHIGDMFSLIGHAHSFTIPSVLGERTSEGTSTISAIANYNMFRVDFIVEWGDGQLEHTAIITKNGVKCSLPIWDSYIGTMCYLYVYVSGTSFVVGSGTGTGSLTWADVTGSSKMLNVKLYGIYA
jgi:hypothetical protein